jgi:hypothetical protein
MPRVFVGNFDFEHELAEGSAYRPTAAVRQLNESLAPAWIAVAAAADAVLLDGAEPELDSTGLREWGLCAPRFVGNPHSLDSTCRWELVPWGWTPRGLELAQQQGWQCRAPNLALVRRLNSRSYRLRLEQEFQFALPQAREIRSIDELVRAVATSTRQDWVIKANFGMAARERMLWRGRRLPDHVRQWAAKRLTADPVLILEPWLDRVAEAGIQFDLPESGAPRLVGVTPLLTDRTGAYLGSLIGNTDETLSEWSEAIAAARQIAERVQQDGYFGPLGIDAMQHLDDTGRLCLRPLQDLNARYTMGRLALGFERVLQRGESAAWLHFALTGGAPASFAGIRDLFLSRIGACGRVIVTGGMRDAAGAVARSSVLAVVPSAAALSGVEQALKSLQ